MLAPLFLQTQKSRVSGKNLLPNGNFCKLHRGDPAEKVIHSSVSKAVPAVCGSPFCPVFEHDCFCWMNNMCSGSFFKPGLCCSLMSFFLTSYLIGSSVTFIFCTLRYRKKFSIFEYPSRWCDMSLLLSHVSRGKSHGALPKNIILKSCVGEWSIHSEEQGTRQCISAGPSSLPLSLPPGDWGSPAIPSAPYLRDKACKGNDWLFLFLWYQWLGHTRWFFLVVQFIKLCSYSESRPAWPVWVEVTEKEIQFMLYI